MNLRLLTLVASALASHVHQLTTDEFEEFLADKDLSIVEFYAPWCGHCKSLAPEYEEAAKVLSTHDGAKIALAKVDCTEEGELCAGHGIRGYPTLNVFKGSEKVGSYDGPRTSDDIVQWMLRRSAPAVTKVDTDADIKAVEDPIIVLGLFDAEDSTEGTFSAIADSFRDRVKFVQAPAALAKEYNVESPAVVVLKDGETLVAESLEEAELTSFVNIESFPKFGEIGPSNYLEYTQSGIPLMFAFVENDEQRKEMEEWFEPTLKELHGKANIVFLDTEKFGGHAENVNIKPEWPAVVAHDIKTNRKFPHPQGSPITAASLKKYIKDFSAGKVEASIKSEPIPESQDAPVFTLVGKQYDEVVIDNDQDVLVEFYAPWCGHCKTLAPIYDQLGESYAGNKNVRIAKIDHTLNEVPDVIEGYPTIKLFPAGDKSNPIVFDRSRNLEELQKFVETKGTHKAVASPIEAGEADEAHEDL